MTREQLDKIRETVKRSEEIIATLDQLNLSKAGLSNATISCRNWNTGDDLLNTDLLRKVITLGVRTMIVNLEQELSDISIQPRPVPLPAEPQEPEANPGERVVHSHFGHVVR